ncbi:MAG: glycoside hydrolase [Porphyromonadaceae bacterium]|nr:MAG: glycoside hydrolase [Porphyromonadaceae bacterium]
MNGQKAIFILTNGIINYMWYQSQNKISNPWILLMILGVVVSCKPARNDLELSKFLIDSIQSQAVPDSRIEVFSIKASYFGNGILLKGKTTNSEALAKLQVQLKLQQVSYIDSIIRLPDTALGEKTWGLVTLSVANLRYNPAHSAEMATQALMGTPVKVLQEENGWFLVQTPDQYIAWTESAGIVQLTQSELERWKSSERLIYLADNGLIINTTDKNARPVSDIVMGGILTKDIGGKGRGLYVPVELPDGRKGFISHADCRNFKEWSEQIIPDSTALLNSAFNLLGRPYLWGGTSIKAFDCSGFTKCIYLLGGLILSRDASQQVIQGSEIPQEAIWKELKSGDLLFFGRQAVEESPEKVTHVGMYIGDSEFIHCSGLVRVNSLDSTRTNFKPYYHTNLLHVKRIIGTQALPESFKSHPWYN